MGSISTCARDNRMSIYYDQSSAVIFAASHPESYSLAITMSTASASATATPAVSSESGHYLNDPRWFGENNEPHP